MDQWDTSNRLFRAFHLGARALLNLQDQKITNEQVKGLWATLRQIADGDLTLHDPAADSIKRPSIKEFIAAKASVPIRNDKDLAKEILLCEVPRHGILRTGAVPSHESIKARLNEKPFRPMRIIVGDGSSYDVSHPDLLWVGFSDLQIGFAHPDHPDIYDKAIRIAMSDVVGIDDIPPTKSSMKN